MLIALLDRLNQLTQSQKNIPRWVTMYMAQQYGSLKLKEIAEEFGLKRTGSIPTTIKKLMVALDGDRNLLRKFNRIKSQYDT